MVGVMLDSSRAGTPRASETVQISPLFLIGAIRSGTSLLHALLNQHPDVGLLYECDAHSVWPIARKDGVQSDWRRRLNFWNGSLSRHDLNLESGESFTGKGRGRAVMELYQDYCQREGARIGGEKSPTYLDKMRDLAREYPQAGFIVIWRDPEAVWASAVRAGRETRWFRQAGLYARLARSWRRALRDVSTLKRSGVPIHEITYDALVSSPGAVMAGVWSFLDLEPHALDPNAYHANREAYPEGAHHAKAQSGRIQAIRHEDAPLSRQVQRRVRALTARLAADFPDTGFAQAGYGRDFRPASRLRHGLSLFLGAFWLNVDRGKRILYAVLPPDGWRAYRNFRNRKDRSRTGKEVVTEEDRRVSA